MTEPSKDLLAWAGAAIGPGTRIVEVRSFRPDPKHRGPWLLRIQSRTGELVATLKTGPLGPAALRNRTDVTAHAALAAEAAGLRLAEEHGLPAPRLLGLDLEGVSGSLALLSTMLGEVGKTPGPESMRAFGAATAVLHTVSLSPNSDVELRTRPRHGDDYVWLRKWAARYQAATESQRIEISQQLLADRPGWPADGLHQRLLRTSTTPLIQAAEERIAGVTPPDGTTVLVHGDLCAGNTAWSDDGFAGFIDWEGYGAGHYGVDLGNLRFEESLRFGLAAADEILLGWQEASGQDASDIAYWDLVSALNTPADLTPWAPDMVGGTERRDRFLRAAIERFDGA